LAKSPPRDLQMFPTLLCIVHRKHKNHTAEYLHPKFIYWAKEEPWSYSCGP